MNEYPQFNDWRGTRLIGAGKVGQTFEIMRSDGFGTEDRGALKVIRVPAEERPEAQHAQRAKLEAVAQTLRAADAIGEHPNLLPWRDHAIRSAADGDGWEICLRTELATPLEQYIRSHTYGERDVINMAAGACAALEEYHSRGIVHGDVKPENLFVSEPGYDSKPTLRLGDVGNAPLVPDAAGDFAAPEILCGDVPTEEHDLYALGMVLYWMLNDRRVPYAPSAPAPVSAADRAIARDMRLRGDPMPPPAHGSSALHRVILRAIADRPEDRFQTAEEFRAALDGVARAADARAADAERAERAAALQAQRMREAQARQARMHHDEDDDAREGKRSALPIVIGVLCGIIVLAIAAVLLFHSIGSKKTDDEGTISYLKLNQTEVEIAPDDKVSLVCTAYDSDGAEVRDAEIVWSTSAQGVATVNTDGTVTGHAEGDATITASVKGDDDVNPVKCTVTVSKDAVKVERLKLSDTSKDLEVDETFRLSYELTPAKASAGEVTWSSSDKSVAIVDDDGLVRAVSTGTATIKLTVSNGVNNKELSATCTVKVAESAKVQRVIANDSSVTLTAEGASTTISFTVSGKDVDAFSDRVSIRPEDGSILQISNIKRTGSGDTNTYTVTVTALRSGISSVNFVISDGSGEHTAKTQVTVDIPFTPAPEPSEEPSPDPTAEPEE